MGSLKRQICYFETFTMKGNFFSITVVLLHVKVTIKRQNLGFEQVSILDVHKSFVFHRIFSKLTHFIYIFVVYQILKFDEIYLKHSKVIMPKVNTYPYLRLLLTSLKFWLKSKIPKICLYACEMNI